VLVVVRLCKAGWVLQGECCYKVVMLQGGCCYKVGAGTRWVLQGGCCCKVGAATNKQINNIYKEKNYLFYTNYKLFQYSVKYSHIFYRVVCEERFNIMSHKVYQVSL